MTTEPGPYGDVTLDDYLDGLLDQETAARFEDSINADRGLQVEIERQTAVNGALQRMCTPSTGVEQRVVEAIRKAATTTPVPPISMAPTKAAFFHRRRWAIAALLALGIVAAWRLAGVIEQRRVDRDEYGPKPWTSVVAYYRNAVQNDFTPEWICKTDKEFADTFKKRFRQPLLLASDSDTVAALGLGYANCLTPRTVTLLVRVQDKPVVVFVDNLKKETPPEIPPDSGLHLFRKEMGRLVLYEVSPLTESLVLDLFYVPD